MGSPPNSNSYGAVVSSIAVTPDTPLKFAMLHAVTPRILSISVTLQTKVVKFAVPSKSAMTEPLGGSVGTAPKPIQTLHPK